MNTVMYMDPDQELSGMVHRNHVARAHLHGMEIPDAAYEQIPAKSGPVLQIFRKAQEPERGEDNGLSIRKVSGILGGLARIGAGIAFAAGIADGLIDTTYGLTLTIICIGWGLLHLLKVVAHG